MPKIKDVSAFRSLVAPFVKRRVLEEPDVREHVRIPERTDVTEEIEWDTEHLLFYHRVATEFAEWYKSLSPYDKKANLIAILRRIQVVQQAASFPQRGIDGFGAYMRPTSKQLAAIARVRSWAEAGHKTILFAQSPVALDWFVQQFASAGLEAVPFHGEIPIARRVAVLDKRFRGGPAPILCASMGACQTGYNIHQASRILFHDRDWTPKTEMQSAARALRPQQTRPVEVRYLHLAGSIDCYQAQMVAFKASAMRAGLDYGEDEVDPEDFLHFDTILGRFVEDVEAKLGSKLRDLRGARRRHGVTRLR